MLSDDWPRVEPAIRKYIDYALGRCPAEHRWDVLQEVESAYMEYTYTRGKVPDRPRAFAIAIAHRKIVHHLRGRHSS